MTGDATAIAPRVFAEVHTDLPREAPGSRACTARALVVLGGRLPEAPRVLDIACGPGTQTVDLAALLPGARITAVDAYEPFVTVARDRVRAGRLEDRVEVRLGDMRHLDQPDGSVDLIWCEGAVYIMGVRAALGAWRRLLRAGAFIGFTEAVWVNDSAPAELKDWWADGYPGMMGIDVCLATVTATGFDVLDHFLLPESAWWEDYYAPMEARLTMLRQKYRDDPSALAALADNQREVDYYRRWSAHYGYLFVVAQKSGETGH